jgi:hypothetical protein
MDEPARGIATAALTLQSNLLQALVRKSVLTSAEARSTSWTAACETRPAIPMRPPTSHESALRGFARALSS